MIVLLFGPPGCGKGTQANSIASRFQIPAISTGEMFRAECKAGTSLGRAVCAILAKGELVGDDIVNEIVRNRIGRPDCGNGFLLDGYPRTVPQARLLDRLLEDKRLPKPTVIHLDVPAPALVARLSSRRQCPLCGRIYNLLSQPPDDAGRCNQEGAALIRRDDDREEVILERLKAYEALTGPVLGYYGAQAAHRIDGTRTPEEVFSDIEAVLAPYSRATSPRPSTVLHT